MNARVWLMLSALFFVTPVASASDTTPATAEGDFLDQIRWVDSSDVDAMFKADIAVGKRLFYVYCAYACNVLGVDYRNALVCYPTAHYREMPGGSDAIVGGEYDRLEGKLVDFTKTYNLKLADYLTLHGMNRCKPGEDWKDMVPDLDEALGGFDQQGNFKEWADASYDKAAHRFRYATYLVPEHMNDAFYKQKLCAIANTAKLSGKVIFEIYNASTKTAQMSITCDEGVESRSAWTPKPGDNPVMPGFDDKQESVGPSG